MTLLRPADAGEAADLAAFLGRLVKWDKTAVVRLQVAEAAVAVFGRPPFGEVLAVRTHRLAGPVEPVDATVSAGQLLEGIDEAAGLVPVPPGVTGPSWAGVLPPRGGWRRLAEPEPEALRSAAAAIVAEFRARTEALPAADRTRQRLDALAEEVWSRELPGSALPLRAVHAAHALGLLRPVRVPAAGPAGAGAGAPDDGRPAVLGCGRWLRLRTPYGSVAVRRGGPALTVSPR